MYNITLIFHKCLPVADKYERDLKYFTDNSGESKFPIMERNQETELQ